MDALTDAEIKRLEREFGPGFTREWQEAIELILVTRDAWRLEDRAQAWDAGRHRALTCLVSDYSDNPYRRRMEAVAGHMEQVLADEEDRLLWLERARKAEEQLR